MHRQGYGFAPLGVRRWALVGVQARGCLCVGRGAEGVFSPGDGDRVWVHMAGGVAAVGLGGHTTWDRERRCAQVLRWAQVCVVAVGVGCGCC